jgi:hypothetical protein
LDTLPEFVRGAIRLPRTSTRADTGSCFAKLIRRVREIRTGGFEFEGKFLRPGARLTLEQLRPSPEYPSTPIIIEYARGAKYGPGLRRREYLYIAWRFDVECHQWRELGRAVGIGAEWTDVLRPIIVCALKQARGDVPAIALDVQAVADRISAFLDAELMPLDEPDRRRIIAVVHDQFAFRLSA